MVNCKDCGLYEVWDHGLCGDCLSQQKDAEKARAQADDAEPLIAKAESLLRQIVPLVSKNVPCPFGENPGDQGIAMIRVKIMMKELISMNLGLACVGMTSEKRDTWMRDSFKGTAQLWRISHTLVPEGKGLYWYTWEEIIEGGGGGGGGETCWVE